MKLIFAHRSHHCLVLAICLSAIAALSGCAKATVPVSIHGVNYSAQTFSYVIEDPANSKNSGGGELIEPFSAGGAMCCYELPSKWQAGMKVKIIGRHWLPKKPDGSLPEIVETKVVEVPQYVDGKAGELWVLRGADGSLGIISSDFQPNHAKWPGRVKGWPIPSLEYQRERWDIYVKHEEGGVRLFQKLLKELRESPAKRAAEDWEFSKERDPKAISGFSDSRDPNYLAHLKRDYEEGLKRSEQQLNELKARRP